MKQFLFLPSSNILVTKTGRIMMYPYVEFSDATLVTHSELRCENGKEFIEVHFEKPIEGGFCSARIKLPQYEWVFNKGYSEKDLQFFDSFLKHNEKTLFKYSRCGGVQLA